MACSVSRSAPVAGYCEGLEGEPSAGARLSAKAALDGSDTCAAASPERRRLAPRHHCTVLVVQWSTLVPVGQAAQDPAVGAQEGAATLEVAVSQGGSATPQPHCAAMHHGRVRPGDAAQNPAVGAPKGGRSPEPLKSHRVAAHLPSGVLQAAASEGRDLEVHDLPVGRQRGLRGRNHTRHRPSTSTVFALALVAGHKV